MTQLLTHKCRRSDGNGRRDDRQLCNDPATGVATVSPNGGVTRAWPGARRDAGSSLGLVSLGKSWSC